MMKQNLNLKSTDGRLMDTALKHISFETPVLIIRPLIWLNFNAFGLWEP